MINNVNHVKENLLVNVLVSPLADFTGVDAKKKKESMVNRVQKLSEPEQKWLFNEFDKILKLKKDSIVFTENGIGVLLLKDTANAKKNSIISIFNNFSSGSIISKIEKVRRHLLNIVEVKKYEETDFEEKVKSSLEITNKNKNLIMKQKNEIISKNSNLENIWNMIKEERNYEDINSKEFILKLYNLINNESIFNENESIKLKKIIGKALVETEAADFFNFINKKVSTSIFDGIKNVEKKGLSQLIHLAFNRYVAISIISKINENKKCICQNEAEIQFLVAMGKEQELYISYSENKKSEDINKVCEKDINLLKKIIKSLETVNLFISASDDYKIFVNNFNSACEIVISGLDNQDYKLFNTSIEFIKSFVNLPLNGNYETILVTLNLNTVDKYHIDGNQCKNIFGVLNYFKSLILNENNMNNLIDNGIKKTIEELGLKIDSGDQQMPSIEVLKMNFCKTYIFYLNNLFKSMQEDISNKMQSKNNDSILSCADNNLINIDIPNEMNLDENKDNRSQINSSSIPSNNINNQVNNNPIPAFIQPAIDSNQCEKIGDINVPIQAVNNGTSLEERKSLAEVLFRIGSGDMIYDMNSIDGTLRELKSRSLIKITYQNFYFIMKEAKAISEEGQKNLQFGEVVFMKEGCWKKLVNMFNTNANWNDPANWMNLNSYRRKALLLTVEGITRDS